jgi:uncharacterized RDD family membrane protein YckC
VIPGRREEAAGFATRAVAFLTDAVAFGVALAATSWVAVQVATLLARPNFSERLAPWVVTVDGVVLAMAYFVVSWSAYGRTPGKALLGLAVITKDGARPSVGRSILRYFGYLISTIPLGLGFLWVLVDNNRRAWHDHLAGTRVVYRESRRAEARRASHGAGAQPSA